MPVDGSGAYLPPKPKKPKQPKSTISGSSTSDATPHGFGSAPKTPKVHPTYKAPAYTPPPSYARPPKPRPLDTRTEASFLPQFPTPKVNPVNFLKQALRSGEPDPTIAPVGSDGSLTPEMQDFMDRLRNLGETPNAPKGYALGDEKRQEGEFAWVPERFKTKANGRLKNYWNADFIKSSQSDFAYDSQYQSFLNDIMEKQFQDREKWLLGRNERHYNEIKDVLDTAANRAYEGHFNYLERYQKEHPNFTFDSPTYRSQFGITPDAIVNQWMRDRGSIHDPYMRGALRSRMDKMRKHYERMQRGPFFSYRATDNMIQEAMDKYASKYNKDVDFSLHSTDETKKAAAEKAGAPFGGEWTTIHLPLGGTIRIPKGGGVNPSQYDKLADSKLDSGLGTLIGGSSKKRDIVEKSRERGIHEAMTALGTTNLPTVKQMLMFKVQAGELDPKNHKAVEAEIHRLRNPYHPETRAMYVSYKMQRDPNFDAKGTGLDFINAPIVEDITAKNEHAKYLFDEQTKLEQQAAANDGSQHNGVWDTVTDVFKGVKLQGYAVQPDKTRFNGGQDVNTIGWTFDKLMRLNYGVAGAAQAWYGLDKTGTPIIVPGMGPSLTGQSWTNSIDELLRDPSKIGSVFDAGYKQVFRGSGLPGTSVDTIPVTWSNVIHDNALRDPEQNFYDKSWYQHIAGFALDAGTDPLNFVGVGVVNDAIKLPTRVTKGMKDLEKGGEATVDTLDVLKRIQAPNLGPVAEKVYRTDQSLKRLDTTIDGKQYAGDGEIWDHALDTTTHKQVVDDINHQLNELRIQKVKLKNDVGVSSLHEDIAPIAANDSVVDFATRLNLRTNRVLNDSKVSTTIKDTKLSAPGGRFHRDFIKPYQDAAKARGFSTTKYADTTIGKAAQKAEKDLNKLLDDIDSGALHADDAAVVKQRQYLENTINKAFERDEVGVLHAWNNADIEGFRKAGEPGLALSFDPTAAFARSMNMSKEDFLTAYNITERDVHDALLHGPSMMRVSDPAAQDMWLRAENRRVNAKKALENPHIKGSYRSANETTLARAYRMHNTITVEGAIRYLENLRDMRYATGSVRTLELQGERGALEALDRAIGEKAGFTGTEHVGDYHGTRTLHDDLGQQFASGKGDLHEVNWKNFDFTDVSIKDLEDLLARQGSKSSTAFWEGARNALQRQIHDVHSEIKDVTDNLVDHSVGLPPAKAYELDKMLPADSLFRTKSGGINEDKIREAFSINDKHLVTYKAPEKATASDYAFLDTLRGAMQYDYDTFYSLEKTKLTTSVEREAGGRAKALGPRPTVESLRKQYPNIFKNHVKGGMGKDIHYVKEQGGAKGVPGVFAEETPQIAVGSKTRKQETLSEFIARKQKKWDKAHARAVELDAAEFRKVDTSGYKVTKEQAGLIKQKAFKGAVDAALKNLKQGKVARVVGNGRLTVNESASALRKAVNDSTRAKLDDLNVEAAATDVKAELDLIEAKRKALLKERKDHLKAIEAARVNAHVASKEISKRVGEEEIIQVGTMPPRATGRMIQVRIMGMRKNLQFTNGLFEGAEKAAKLIPEVARIKFAENFVRPSKQLTQRESIMFRAMMESKTPVIIKAHLSRMSDRMRGIGDAERRDMFKAYRNDLEYEGVNMSRYEGAMSEIKDIENIFNGTDEFYHFKPNRSTQVDALSPWEINHYMRDQYKMNIKVLNRSIAESKDGKITAQMILDSIKANGGRIEDLLDPYRFSWTVRLAADQARQYRALNHLMAQTFGVALPAKASQRKVLMKLEDHGWVREGNTMYPPEILNDIKKLREFARPGEAQAGLVRLLDNAMGYWKQSMTIYNPGYYTRNGIGEMMTSWLDGVSHPKWYRMAYRVHRYSKNEDKNLAALIERWSVLKDQIPVDVAKGGEVLFRLKGGEKITVDEALKQYVHMGLKSTFANTDIGHGLRSVAGSAVHKTKLGKGISRVNESVHDAGEGFEDYLRMAHFLHAMENSGATSIHQAAMHAAERVRRAHFDYTDFSKAEKAVMVRLFPFYKWTRRGAPLMLSHLFLTPGKMGVLPKAMDTVSGLGLDPVGLVNDDPVLSTSDVSEDTNGGLPDYTGIAPAWVRDLFAYQISPATDDEYGNYFRIQTPQVDGLNAVLGATPIPGTEHPTNPLDAFAQSGFYPLLNPLIKGGIEIGNNLSMDPSSPYEIYGGDYNEMNGISDPEAIGSYIARSTNPIAGFLAKLSKNGDLGPLSMGDGEYRDAHGYNSSRDIASILTGLGFYQGKLPSGSVDSIGDPPNPRSVGKWTLDDLISLAGRKPAQDSVSKKHKDGPSQDGDVTDILKSLLSDGTDNADSLKKGKHGSGWIPNKYGKHGSGWIPNKYGNSGGYGYGSGSYYSGYSGSSGSSGFSSSSVGDFLALIQKLIAAADQGDIYKDGDVQPPK